MAAEPLGAPWFSPPCELLPAPAAVVGCAGRPQRARRPPALPRPPPPAEPAAAAPKRPKPPPPPPVELPPELPDRAAGLPETLHLRHGRCLSRGRVVAVPQAVEDMDEELEDARKELLVVELAAPGGGWFEDADVQLVRVQTADGARLVPVAPLRKLVMEKVQLFARPTTSLRKLHVPCRSRRAPEHVVALLSLAELGPLLEGAEVAP